MGIEVGRTIAEQIGTRAFMMMGAKNLMASDTSLQFKVGRNAKGVTNIVIRLDPSDTYTVRFARVRGSKITDLAVISDVYADSLHVVIEEHTGLYLSL
jgi:hypothetical protein